MICCNPGFSLSTSMANSFPSSSSSPRRNDKAKRKYSHEPLMRVEKQTHNSEGSSYRVVTAASLAQPKIVFQTTSTNFQNASKPTNHAQSSPFSKPKPVPAVTNHSFVLSTVGSMKNGERPTVLVAPSRPYEIELDYDQPAAKRRRLLNDASAPRKRIFRTSRPLKISDKVNSDIWQTILGYCDPKLLLEARTINQEFRQLLQDRTAIWKESRENTFGQDMPDCPTGTTEQQYADLLVGRGCQNRNCPKEQTAGVYWTFQVRLCADCFKQKTLRVDTFFANISLIVLMVSSASSPMNFPSKGDITLRKHRLTSTAVLFGNCYHWHVVMGKPSA